VGGRERGRRCCDIELSMLTEKSQENQTKSFILKVNKMGRTCDSRRNTGDTVMEC
jgi:hypothetical protein